MSEAFAKLCDLPLRHLEVAAREAVASDDPLLLGVAVWLQVGNRADLGRLISLANKVGSEIRDYRDVALLGYAIGSASDKEEWRTAFRGGVDWLRGRRFFVPGQPPTLEAHATALFGLVLGLRDIRDEPGATWLSQLIEESLRRWQGEAWDAALISACKALLNPLDGPSVETVGDEIAPALAARQLMQMQPEAEVNSLQTIVTADLDQVSCERTVFRLAGIRWLLRCSANALPGRATIDDLLQVLKGIQHSLKRWSWESKPRTTGAGAVAQKWDVQNEYHVQNLLWAILAPVFPDLEDEEYLKSIGHKHARVDLAIPSLQAIVEVKFVRTSRPSAFADVTEEIAADTALYLSNNAEFKTLVVFVWDHSRATEQHTELLSGLHKLKGVKRAVVVSRPGGWT